MAAIRGTDTRPEMQLRSALHRRGFRFRLHERALPGRPDIVFPKFRAAVFVNGCFWHGHACHLFRWPATREQFWREKISATVSRDQANVQVLLDRGWRVCTVWECALKGRHRLGVDGVANRIASWLRSGDTELTLCNVELANASGDE